jgi:serine/threonine/tyrosine-interacting protein
MDFNNEMPFPVRYVPTQPYDSTRGNEPRRVVVPAPELDFNGDDGKPAFHVRDVPPFQYGHQDFGPFVFLMSLRTLHKLQLPHSMLAWKYEHRRLAQPILPFLLLGPSNTAQSSESVKENGITYMLSVRDGLVARRLPRYLDPASFTSAKGLETATFDLDNSYECIRNLRPVIKAINDHLQRHCTRNPIYHIGDVKGKVLVFCETGCERSPVIVAAYLMVVYGVDAITAIQIVQSQRFCISLAESMKNMLLNFENILVAERQVARETPGFGVLNKAGKRTRDGAFESDEEMEDVEWPEPNQGNGRPGLAPFADSGF